MLSFIEFLEEQTMGININDDKTPWTEMILSGKKTIETRNKPTLNSYIGKRVGIIRTGKKKKATLVGYCTIGEPIKYESAEEFDKDFKKHRVSSDSAFYNGGIKYGYPLLNVTKTNEKIINTRGIISRKIEDEDNE